MSASGAISRVRSNAPALSDPPEHATRITSAALTAAAGDDGFITLWICSGAPGYPLDFAACFALLDGLAFVILLLAAPEPEFYLYQTALEVHAQRHEGQALLLQVGHCAFDLTAVQQQFAIAARFVL